MFKKTITYSDFDGQSRTEDHYFNLSKAELIEMEMTTQGGYGRKMEAAIKAGEKSEIFKLIKELIVKSYGIKSPNGKTFIKSAEITNEFLQSEAYSVFLMDIISDAGKLSEFFNKIMPSDLRAQVEKMKKDGQLPEIIGNDGKVIELVDN